MRRADLPAPETLAAPASWRAVEVISDLHLQPGEPGTFDAWRRYMASTGADAIVILGDLFEVWVGDDAAASTGFAADCAAVLRQTAARRAVHFMRGNRDFLVGDDFLRGCGVVPLADPTVLAFGGRRWLLSHGDALCLDDTDYLRFRAMVRSPAWQHEFLARPLAERQQIGRQMREASQAAQRQRAMPTLADVDHEAALACLTAANAGTLIHGHTHRPAEHALDATHLRVVLSDWDAQATPPRLEALRLDAGGWHRVALA